MAVLGKQKLTVQLAEHAFWAGDYRAAIKYYSQYMKEDPGPLFRYSTYLRLGYACKLTERPEQAEDYFSHLDNIIKDAVQTRNEYSKYSLKEIMDIAPAEKIDAILVDRLVSTRELQKELVRARRAQRRKDLVLETTAIFTYNIYPQFLQWVAKAYSTTYLDISRITANVEKVISMDKTSVYAKDDWVYFVLKSVGVAFLITSWEEISGTKPESRIRETIEKLGKLFAAP
jgi:tetratricopeptide (TPR) repeat protein